MDSKPKLTISQQNVEYDKEIASGKYMKVKNNVFPNCCGANIVTGLYNFHAQAVFPPMKPTSLYESTPNYYPNRMEVCITSDNYGSYQGAILRKAGWKAIGTADGAHGSNKITLWVRGDETFEWHVCMKRVYKGMLDAEKTSAAK